MSTLDWRDLAPAQETHECDCDYCDRSGDLEEVQWPLLVRMMVGDVEYVTDRFLAVRADMAPIPDDYEGPVMGPEARGPSGFLSASATSEPATGLHFRWQIIKAVEATGWVLRLLDHPDDASEHVSRAVGVVTRDGEHIGWAMSAKHIYDDAWHPSFTREYVEPTPGGAA